MQLDARFFEVLAERGFKRLPACTEVRPSPPPSGRPVPAHPLDFLADLRCENIRFARREDEMFSFEHEGEVMDLFATSDVGRFLFVGRTDGRVHQHIDWSPDGAGPTFEPINGSLRAFVRCHCMEQSVANRLRAAMLAEEDVRVADADTRNQCEAELRAFIASVDAAALDSVYWSTVLYEIEDGFYKVVPTG